MINGWRVSRRDCSYVHDTEGDLKCKSNHVMPSHYIVNNSHITFFAVSDWTGQSPFHYWSGIVGGGAFLADTNSTPPAMMSAVRKREGGIT